MKSKYQEIYRQLLTKIETKEIEGQSYLPSENELMKQYQASRDTIRKSLQLLLQNGYIQKVKGKGSLVLDVDKIAFPVSGISSFKELSASMHGEVKTIVHKFRRSIANETERKHLFMKSGEIYSIQRIRNIDGENIILDTDIINAEIIDGITSEIASDSLYAYIEDVLGLRVSFSRKEITVVKATEEEMRLLNMQEYDLLVSVKSYSYLDDATLFQYTISKHRPDKFRFVDFARRD